MRASHYAKALHEALKEPHHGEDAIVKHFVATVQANGHEYLLKKIARAYERIVTKEEKQSTIEVTSAETITEERVVALLKKEPFKHALSASHKRVSRKTDAGIVGGIVVRTGTTLVDASYKRALLDMYQSLIST